MSKIMIALTVSTAMLFPAFAQTKPKATVTFPSGTKDGTNVRSTGVVKPSTAPTKPR